MAFRKLLRKEIRSIFPLYGVVALAIVLLHAFAWYKSSAIQSDGILVVTVLLPFFFAAVITLGAAYYQLHTEWRTNSIYLLLTFPIRGWKVLTAKMTALLVLLILLMIWICGSFAIFILKTHWQEWNAAEGIQEMVPTMIVALLHMMWLGLLFTILLILLIQFTFLCGQLVPKFRWVVRFIAWVGIMWLVIRISPIVSKLLGWLPDIKVGGPEMEAVFFHPGPFIVLVILTIGLLTLNGWLFEKEVEV